jgi:MarR family protein
MTGTPPKPPVPFWGELDSLVFAGAYDEVAKRAAVSFADADAPAVVAALALGGRLDEAESVFAARLRAAGDRRSQARFFLIAGYCHAGNPAKATALVVESARLLRAGSARERYWACQGLGLLRHFEGRSSRARRAARQALTAAMEADFPYGRFLSLDLSAHVAVATGNIHAGMRLLTQASELADALGYAENAATERATQLLFELRFSIGGEAALRAVRELVTAPGASYFMRRNGLLELSSAYALRGEAERALADLEESRRVSLPGKDRRARARYFTGHALCLALSRGAEAARPSLLEARAEAENQLTLRGEIAFVELVFCRESSPRALAEAERIATQTGAERVRVAHALAAGQLSGSPARVEDGLCRLLLEAAPLPPLDRLRCILDSRMLGLVPWALGAAPGQRLISIGNIILTENHGNVTQNELSNRPARKLLAELGRGYRSRAELMRDVWNIVHFVPARHTPTLHTAISRLRVALAVPDWIVTYDDGYALAAGVEVLSFGELEGASVGLGSAAAGAWPGEVAGSTGPPGSSRAPAAGGAPGLGGAPGSNGSPRSEGAHVTFDPRGSGEPARARPSLPPPDDRQRLLAYVAQHGPQSSAELARALRLSGSTALRLLRGLVAEGLLDRQGSGRATRYHEPMA